MVQKAAVNVKTLLMHIFVVVVVVVVIVATSAAANAASVADDNDEAVDCRRRWSSRERQLPEGPNVTRDPLPSLFFILPIAAGSSRRSVIAKRRSIVVDTRISVGARPRQHLWPAARRAPCTSRQAVASAAAGCGARRRRVSERTGNRRRRTWANDGRKHPVSYQGE